MASKSMNPRDLISRSQSGVALLVAIIMTTLIAIIAGGIAYKHELNKSLNARALTSERAILLVLSAESYIKKILRDDIQDNDTDSFDDDWAQAIPVLPVEDGFITGCVVDLQSQFNINNLEQFSQEDKFLDAFDDVNSNAVQLYLSLLELAELDFTIERAALVVDWIDNNSELVSFGSAEDNEYSFEKPSRLAANTKLTSLNELVTISGYSLADVRALSGLVTALPVTTPVNINTADARTLVAMSELIDEFSVDEILESRPYDNVNDFYQIVADLNASANDNEFKAQIPGRLFDIKSSFFELRAQVTLGSENIALKSLLQRTSGEVKTLSRTFEYIPELELSEDDENPIAALCPTTNSANQN